MKFGLIRQTALLPDAQAQQIAGACLVQIQRDLSPAWGFDPSQFAVRALAGTDVLAPDEIPVVLNDTTNSADLAYHTIGPGVQVFVRGIINDGGQILTGADSVSSCV